MGPRAGLDGRKISSPPGFFFVHLGTAVAQWLRCCATNRKVAGSIPAGVIGILVCQDIADSLDNGDKIDAIVDFSKAFDLVPHGRLLTKIANSGVDSRVVVWIREFL